MWFSEEMKFVHGMERACNLCIIITITEIIHPLVLYLKHNFSETGFCLRLQVESAQSDPTDRASICLQTSSLYLAQLSMTTER
jgi:hypothetical protein